MALNNYQWQVMRTMPTKAASVFNLDVVTRLSAQLEMMNKKIDSLHSLSQVHPIMQYDSNPRGVANPEYPPYGYGMENEQAHYTGKPFLATAKTKIDVGTRELILRVGDESISLQAFDSARTSSDKVEKVNLVGNQIGQLSPQETPQGYKPKPNHGPQAVQAHNSELLVESDPRQETVVSEEDGTITLQALDSARTSSNKGTNINSIDNHLVQPSLEEASRNHLAELDLRPSADKEETHKEQSLRVDKLKE
ncbi:protein kinase 2B, chloroplastic-like [Gossypium australe]|uniref:Protein kinase 2B, chloroplastic-like n=1 Tax=Gossypium australe TaxID=47621 RepID=A0A5B6UVM8_9ROSI|nr:protein kinase 2B, chloroplastic-like [Gossypium australe]